MTTQEWIILAVAIGVAVIVFSPKNLKITVVGRDRWFKVEASPPDEKRPEVHR